MELKNPIIKYLFDSIIAAASAVEGFFNTSPDLISEKTAKKLKDPEEAKIFMKEVRQKRDKEQPHFST